MISILFFPGAFNPPRKTHIDRAYKAYRSGTYQAVFFSPAQASFILNVQKKDSCFTDEDRLSMLQKIEATHDWMRVYDREIHAECQPTTFQTLTHLKEEGYWPTLLVGEDVYRSIPHWKNGHELLNTFPIKVMPREEGVSSSTIRQFLSDEKESCDWMAELPEEIGDIQAYGQPLKRL